MRISDWSSAVCSSDLGTAAPGGDSCLSRGAWLTPLRHAVSTRRRVRKVPVLHAADHGGCSFGNPGCVCIGRLVCAVAHRAGQRSMRRSGGIGAPPETGASSRFSHRTSPDEAPIKDARPPPNAAHFRSEEHTSELQSLMRISYAVFCLKKKKTKIIT